MSRTTVMEASSGTRQVLEIAYRHTSVGSQLVPVIHWQLVRPPAAMASLMMGFEA